MTHATPAIDVVGLRKTYKNGTEALKGLTLRVPRGQVVGLLGPNGSGKTTTINLLTTTFFPTAGRGTVLGHDLLRDRDKIRRAVSLVPQYESIDWSLTVDQNLRVFANLLGLPRASERIDELLELLELEDKRRMPAEELSGGQLRRVQVARAFLFPAELYFVDEPTVGLDPVGVERVLAFLRAKAAEGKTIFLASNVMEEVHSVSDRIVFVHRGELAYDGSPEELIRESRLDERVVVQSRTPVPAGLLARLDRLGLTTVGREPLEVRGPAAGRTVVSELAPFIEQGFEVEGLHIYPPTLRDAFIKLTRAAPEEVPVES